MLDRIAHVQHSLFIFGSPWVVVAGHALRFLQKPQSAQFEGNVSLLSRGSATELALWWRESVD